MSFLMLAKSCSGLWIVKAEPKGLGVSLGLAISLGMKATSIWLMYSSELSDDKEADMCVAEWNWGSKSKPSVCSGLKLTSKSRQDEIRYTFDITKCVRIFDYLLQEKQIKLPSNHVIPPLEELKNHAYCKWHNSYSHATNNCNVFR
jgi:hypothetical protein